MYSITEYGAIPNSAAVSTAEIQKAIDACHANGGGVVYVPFGTYTVGSLKLYSNIHMVFEPGATFLGSKNLNDFNPRETIPYPLYQDASHSYFQRSMFYADGCENISVTGLGTVDMQEVWEEDPTPGEGAWCAKRAVKIFAIKNCKNVVITDLTLLHATDVGVYLAGCEKVKISKLTMDVNIDGISPDCCKDVMISDCFVRSGDDSIVLKSSYVLNEKRLCENVVITNCMVTSRCNGIKLGTESNGGFKNIAISNCTVENTFMAGVALEITDGGDLDGVTVNNIAMKNVGTPLFVILSDRGRGPAGTELGTLKNIIISNVTATGPYTEWQAPRITALWESGEVCKSLVVPSSITGQPNRKIENITLANIHLTVPGGGSEEDKKIVLPEITKEYPETCKFGEKFPVHGIFFRHVDNLRVSNVSVTTEEADARDALGFENVSNLSMS